MKIIEETGTKDKLLVGLSEIPTEWALTPVNGNKAAYRKNWNNEPPLTRDELIEEIKKGVARGYGLRTGLVSGGIMAVDCDGQPAHALAESLGGLPPTVSFTSGKNGRAQYLYLIPPEFSDRLKTVKLKTGNKGSDGKEMLLELRWEGCQSVLPPSEHPETGQYRWINPPQERAIAPVPEWVISKMLGNVTQPLPFIASSEPVSLTACLGVEHRQLIESGVGEGQRNDTAFAIACDVIGVFNHLNLRGDRCEDNPRDLFDQFCDRCNPPLPVQERAAIWKSAEKSNPKPCLDSEKIENCVKNYRKQPLRAIGQSVRKNTGNQVGKETLQILKDLDNVRCAFGSRIRYNTRFKQVEIDGEPINPDAPEIDLAKKGEIQIKGSLRIKHQIILEVAKENSYDPFWDYLKDCRRRWDGVSRFAGIAKRYFGTDNPLHQRYLECVLVGTVARSNEPGCKFDTLLVLHGEQGLGKSTWFRKMVSNDFFCDDMGDFKDKDERIKMHQSVWTEWAEIENNISRSTSGKTKAFITTQTDNIRPPYAQRSSPYPRMSVLVGSTNRTDFNHDETGARRFMVIPVLQPIPVDLVDKERDQLWGEAVALYEQGHQFHLSREEQQQANILNEEFTDRSYLQDLLEEFVTNKDEVTTQEIKEWLDSKEDEKSRIGEFSRLERDIKKVMTALGFKHRRWHQNGIKRSGYKRSCPIQCLDRQTGRGQAEDRQGVHPQTPTQQRITPQRTGRTPNTENFVKTHNVHPNAPKDYTDTSKSEPSRSHSDDPSTFGGSAYETPDQISCTTHDDYEQAFLQIFKALAGEGKYRIGRNQLLSRFADGRKAEIFMNELIGEWRLEEKNGFISPISPTKRMSWFSEGKKVEITKNGDKYKTWTGEITRVINKNTVHLMVDKQPMQYLVKDLKPYIS